MNWNELFEIESKKEYFKKLMDFIDNEYKTKTIYPKKEDIFKVFELTPLSNVKVVILGQDPYHNKNQATGLAFSVPFGEKIPPSLANIYKEIESDLGILKLNNGDLTSWATQGVFLLNTILTVEENKPLSHKDKGWEIFTDNIIKMINEKQTPVVFILWGAYARAKKSLITNPIHLIIESAHPSPFSARNGFFGSKPFSKTNEFLKKNNIEEIDWRIE